MSGWCDRGLPGLVPIAAAVLGCSTAYAAEHAPEPLRYEVTPFVGFRTGGDFKLRDAGQRVDFDSHASFALALDMQADEATQYELFYGRQSTVLRGATLTPVSVDVEYLHLGGTVLLDDELRRTSPYILGGVGITRFTPGPTVGRDDTRFSASVGGGLRVPFNRHFQLRLEARGFLTLVQADTAIFCRSDQGGALCRVAGRGSTFFQFELLAGAAYAL